MMAIATISAILFLTMFVQGSLSANMTGCRSEMPFEISAAFGETGNIYSPGFEENEIYPNNLYCVYTIRAPPGQKIKLTFKHMDIDPFDFCGKDAMWIYDGPDGESPIFGVFCGSEAPYPIISSRNAIHILFHTNFLTGRRGFHIKYEVTSNANLCSEGYEICRNQNCFRVSSKCDGEDDCGDGTDEENCGLPLSTSECGLQNILPFDFSGPDRVVGGMGAKQGSWPWQVDMQVGYYYPNGHTCGGTLINSQWAMTALHCLKGNALPDSWRVHIGNHNKFTKDTHEQIRYVDRFIIYPNYTGQEIIGKPIDLNHDIALVKLNAPVKFSDFVRPACLPQNGFEIPLSSKCVATGWGTTRGTGSNTILKQVQLTVRPSSDCNWSYDPTMICTRNEPGLSDSCHGDSGGPLACKIDGKYHVLGIASYVTGTNLLGGACAMPGTGSVYNKVSAKSKWIADIISQYS